ISLDACGDIGHLDGCIGNCCVCSITYKTGHVSSIQLGSDLNRYKDNQKDHEESTRVGDKHRDPSAGCEQPVIGHCCGFRSFVQFGPLTKDLVMSSCWRSSAA